MRSRMRSRAPLREVGSTIFIPPLRSSSLPNPLSRQSSVSFIFHPSSSILFSSESAVETEQ
ncbi:uncharacterized protein A4U43_C10F11810, partial [Asparagus officinalis]